MSYTPSNVLGSTGLLYNTGLDIHLISGICSTYNSQTLPLAYRNALSAAVAADAAIAEAEAEMLPNVANGANYTSIVSNVGANKLPGLLGLTPTSPNYIPYIGGNGLANSAIAQAQLIFPNGDISAFIQNLTRSAGIASITGELFRTSRSIAERPFSDFGPLKKYTDLATAGLGRVSKIPNTNLETTGTELAKLGDSISLDVAKDECLENERQLNEEVRDVNQAIVDQFGSKCGPEINYDGPTIQISTGDGSTVDGVLVDGSTILTIDTGKNLDVALPRNTIPSINNPVDFACRMLRKGGGDIGKLSSKILIAFFAAGETIDSTGTKRAAALLVAAEQTGDGSLFVLAGAVSATSSANGSIQTIQAALVAAASQTTSTSVQAALVAAAVQGNSDSIHAGLISLSASDRKTIDNETANKLDSLRTNKFAQAKMFAILTGIDRPADIQKTKELFGMDRRVAVSKSGLVDDPLLFTNTCPPDEVLTVRSLADIPNFQNNIPEIKKVINSDEVKETGCILNKISGSTNVKSYADLGNIISQFKDAPSCPTLDTRSTFYAIGELNLLKDKIPIFDNDNVGPTVADMIGVVAGGPVGTAISNATIGIQKSLTISEGDNILANLVLIGSTLAGANVEVDYTTTIQGYVDNIIAEMDNLLFSSNGYKQEVAALTGSGYINGCRLLTNQKVSLARMDIDLTQVSFGAKIPLISFGRSIGDIAKDPAMEAILVNLCSTNQYGEALKLHIVEKQNITIMQQFGINPSTILQIPKIDPTEFSF